MIGTKRSSTKLPHSLSKESTTVAITWHIWFNLREKDILHGKNGKNVSYEEVIRKSHSFYEITIGSLMNIKTLNDETIKVLKLTKINDSN